MNKVTTCDFSTLRNIFFRLNAKLTAATFTVCLSLILSACGGSSVAEKPEAPEVILDPVGDSGQVMLILHDDEEDFLSYDIDVLAINLLKEDGTQVSVAPDTTRVDFIQYTDLAELFSMKTIPVGKYTQVSFTLDYSDASIIIQDEFGASYQAVAQNNQGEELASYSLTLQLDEDNPLVITKKELATLTLDLDLATSNQIISFEPAIVQVEPFVNVSVAVDEDREHRARGLLKLVDSENSSVTITVKPHRKKEGDFGEITVATTSETLFEIDGEEVVNADGLATLESLAVDSPIIAFGSIDENRQFEATKILAGSSVAWTGQDNFRGVVTARSEESITLSGVILQPEDQQAIHSSEISLTLSEATKFTGHQQSFTDASVTVGQHIAVLGQLTEETAFDASEGIVQIKLSKISGQVVQVSPLVIDLGKVNRKPSDSYNFAGTGLTSEQDADPENFEINDNNLHINDLAVDNWLSLRGYMTDFGQAPEDFTPQTLIKKDITQTKASFKAHWQEGTASLVIDNETNAISWDTDTADQQLRMKGIGRELLETYLVTSLNSEAEEGRFAIKRNDETIHYFKLYADFIAALSTTLENGDLVHKINTKGTYDIESQAIKAVAVSIILQ